MNASDLASGGGRYCENKVGTLGTGVRTRLIWKGGDARDVRDQGSPWACEAIPYSSIFLTKVGTFIWT